MTCDRCGSDDLAFLGFSGEEPFDPSADWLFTCHNCGAVVPLTNEQLEETHEPA